jgi:hypothetical protein
MKKALSLIALAVAAVVGAFAQSAAASQRQVLPLSGDASATIVRADDNANPDVLPPESLPYGSSYGQWSAQWWQWGLAQPTSVNPLLDTSGTHCDVGQSGGPVWFLAGVWGGGKVSRTCSVPSGRSLFFPLVNAVDVHTRRDRLDTPEELRADLLSFFLPIDKLRASIDGRRVTNLDPETTPYRACAGGDDAICSSAFSVTLPTKDNVFGVDLTSYCPTSGSQSTCSPAVADGVYLMLAPLSEGRHILKFGGVAGGTSQDITYTITMKG